MHNKNERFLILRRVVHFYRGVIIKLVPGNTEDQVFERDYRLSISNRGAGENQSLLEIEGRRRSRGNELIVDDDRGYVAEIWM